MPPEQRADDLLLDRFWDDMILGQPLRSEGVDPLDAVTIGRLHEAARPAIDPNFRRRLRRDLLQRHGNDAVSEPDGAGPVRDLHARALRWATPAAVLVLVLAGMAMLGLLNWSRAPEQVIVVPAVEVSVTALATPPSTTEVNAELAVSPQWRFTDARDPAAGVAPGITVAPDDAIWIVDGVTPGFQIFSPDGQLIGRWGNPGSGDGEFTFAAGSSTVVGAVAFRPDGGFYVADSGNARIQQFTADREFIRSWGQVGQGDGQFVMPIDVDIDAEGNVYVIDASRDDIQKFDANGVHLITFGGTGSNPGQFQDISWGAVDAEGNFWVADTGNDRIQEFSPVGTLRRVIGPEVGTDASGISSLKRPQAVAFTALGSIVVADAGNGRIVVLDEDGASAGAFGEDTLDAPMAIAITGTGDLIVIDGGLRSALQAFQFSPPLATPP